MREEKPTAEEPREDEIDDPSGSGGGARAVPSVVWILLAALAAIVLWKAMATRPAPGAPSARAPDAAQATADAPEKPMSAAECGVACKKDCLGTSDPLAQRACLDKCDERCGPIPAGSSRP